MAKIALVLVFSLAIVLSIQLVVGDEAPSPAQSSTVTSDLKDAASSLTGWATDKLRGYGLLSPTGSESPASSPENSPASAPAYSSRSFGPEPAAAPMS